MKMNRLFASAAMLAALALTACSNEEAIVEQDNELRELTLTATIGADTRTVVTFADNAYKTYWNTNDQIKVWGYETDPSDYAGYSKPSIQGTLKFADANATGNSGKFSGYTTGAGTLKYALYPEPIERITYVSNDIKKLFGAEDGNGSGIQLNQAFQYSMKSTYIYDGNNITNTPMYVYDNAGFSTEIQFKQLCAMVRIPLVMTEFSSYQNLDNTDASAPKVIVTLIADNVIAGSAVVGFTTDAEAPASMKMTGTSNALTKITYEIPENALANGQTVNGSTETNEYVLDFPVPAGTHTFTVNMTFRNNEGTFRGTIYTRTSDDNVLKAGDILIPTPIDLTVEAGSFEKVN